MRKIIILTAVLITLAIGVFTAAQAQSDWEVIDTGFDYILYDMAFPEGQSEIGFAVGSTSTYNGDGIIIQTTDSGDTWEQISSDDLPGLEACFFTSLDTGYVGGWDSYFAKTTDGGATWTEIEVDSDIWYINDMEFWDENNGIVSAWGGLAFVTDDAGETWTEATGIVSGIQDLAYASADVLFSCGGDENIHKSEDGGLTWEEIYSGQFQYVFVGVEFLDEDFGVVGGEDGRILITEDGGETWTTNNTTFFHLWHGFHIFNTDSIYVAGTPEGIYKTTDGGATYVDDFPESSYEPALYKILFTADNNTGYVCGSQGTFMRKIAPETAPSASVDTENILFPETLVDEIVEEIVTITNTGNAVLNVTNISSDDAAFYPDMTSIDIAPGGSQEIIVTFAPDMEGLFAGTLSIESNDPVNPLFEVSMIGEGIGEQLPVGGVDPQEIFYPQTWVGETVDYVVTISNTGEAMLEVTNIESDNAAFYADMTTMEVEAGGSSELTVTFAPDNEAFFEGILTIECNDPVNPVFEVSLQGEGLLQKPIISVVEEIEFDTTTVNYTSTQELEIWNIGNADLEITAINSSDPVFTTDGSTMTIEPGQSEVITISFSPVEQGQYDEELEIISNDEGSPAIVSVSAYAALGTGINDQYGEANSLTAYPNPFENQVVIELKADLSAPSTLRVYNMLGGLVKEIETSNSGSTRFMWDGTNLNGEVAPSGYYFGVLKSLELEKSIKLIKR